MLCRFQVHTPPETNYTAVAARSSPVQLLKWLERLRNYLRSVTNVCISFEIPHVQAGYPHCSNASLISLYAFLVTSTHSIFACSFTSPQQLVERFFFYKILELRFDTTFRRLKSVYARSVITKCEKIPGALSPWLQNSARLRLQFLE